MCVGAMSRGVRLARWTQIDAITRGDVSCRPAEWQLLCQMNSKKVKVLAAQRTFSGDCLLAALRLDLFDLFSCKHILSLCKCEKVRFHLYKLKYVLLRMLTDA